MSQAEILALLSRLAVPEEEGKLDSAQGACIPCSCSYSLLGGFARTVALVTRLSWLLSVLSEGLWGIHLLEK